ncbi:MAG: hypothetical protein AVDCRST_MAG42-396 [uncultured Chthoniobacterales bacterium]|uniref:Uncharacterized protein n=1 Tax=uncultured Chthoniobacterales bacterium TaxID=1836801 RepID=A0A6J4H9S4_9BACT|nr:MAG: hypothetical protein AVDCRST_MAG42-396 [uncultured Chthoniobacterales bacterium]
MHSLFAAATQTDRRSARELQQQWLIATALFVAALWLYTRHNDFSFYYHPDEPKKVVQIRDGTRNFNHPLLLLTVTDFARWLTGGTTDCQRIVELGRWCSAIFAAGAVALFSWLGFDRFGVIGGVTTGVALLIQRRIYEHAHFMKEDAALLAGIALTFVAIDAVWRRPTTMRALFLGVATGVAASGKYVGLLMVPFAVAALMGRRREAEYKPRVLLAFAGAFLVVIAAINYRALLSFGGVTAGFGGEITRLNSRSGIEVDFSRIDWLRRLLDLSPFLLILFLAHLVFAFRNLRQLRLPDLLLTAFPLLLGFMLSFSSKQSGRHVLPAMIIVAVVASFAAIRIAKELHERRARFATPAVLTFVIAAFAYDFTGLALLDRGFQRDHRRELVEWITGNVPHASTIGLEERVGIPFSKPRRFCEEQSPLPQQLHGARFAADLGTLEELRASGMTHIAVIDSHYKTFLNEGSSQVNRGDAEFLRRREFYRRLLSEGRLVWSRETGNVGVLNPSLRLYEIAPVSGTAPATGE